MDPAKILFWLPRLLTILVILFTSIFALDVFSEGYDLAGILLALLMHLLPQIVITLALVAAWRRPSIGGIIFLIIGVGLLLFFGTPVYSAPHLILTYPILLIGFLFLLGARVNRQKSQA